MKMSKKAEEIRARWLTDGKIKVEHLDNPVFRGVINAMAEIEAEEHGKR